MPIKELEKYNSQDQLAHESQLVSPTGDQGGMFDFQRQSSRPTEGKDSDLDKLVSIANEKTYKLKQMMSDVGKYDVDVGGGGVLDFLC